MKNKIKILLADDELLFRKGIMFLLEREKNFEIILILKYQTRNNQKKR